MKIEYSLKQNNPEDKRLNIVINIDLQTNLPPPEKLVGIVTEDVIPCTIYQHPDTSITLKTQTKTVYNNREYINRAFRTNLAPVMSYTKNSRLIIYGPGETNVGYINKTDHTKVQKWLENTIQYLKKYGPETIGKLADINKDTPTIVESVEVKTKFDISTTKKAARNI